MLSSTSGQGNSFNSTIKQPDSNTKRNNNSYNNNNNNNKGMISSSSSSSKSSSTASSSSSPSPFSPSHNNNNNNNNFHHHHHHQQAAAAAAPKAKTMEEVWKDISLASLHDHPCEEQDLSSSTPLTIHNPPPPPPPHHNPNFILQDFLAQPFCKDPPPRIVSGGGGGRGDCTITTTTTTTTATATATATTTTTGLYGSPAPPAPATALSLNTGPAFDFVHISDPLRTSSHLQSHYPVSNISSFNSPFDALGSSSGLPSFGRKRGQDSDISSGDRRQKRMIKNRESAARSRARKQAYTNELELEVTHLLEENASLRRQQEELYMAAAIQLPKKHTLHRTSTAPF